MTEGNSVPDASVRAIPHESAALVVDTLCEAFYHYPVMRFVLGDDVEEFDAPFRSLIGLFVGARVLSGDRLFGIGPGERLEAAATISDYDSVGDAEALARFRAQTWSGLPAAARGRYDAFCEACARFDIGRPHIHLNMVGVRKAFRGLGHARRLVEHVITLSNDDPGSHGVSLSTESAANVPFYQNLGFELIGHAVVGPGLETWNFFKARSA